MKNYEVTLNGSNYDILNRGAVRKLGFYTIRVVRANNEDEAKQKAIRAIKLDDRLSEMTKNHILNPPKIEIAEVNQINHNYRNAKFGYSFYNEDFNLTFGLHIKNWFKKVFA